LLPEIKARVTRVAGIESSISCPPSKKLRRSIVMGIEIEEESPLIH
jgi:hypothetical protein